MALIISSRTLYVSLCVLCVIMLADIIDILTTNPSIQFAEEVFFSPNSSVIQAMVAFHRKENVLNNNNNDKNYYRNQLRPVNSWNYSFITKCERKCFESQSRLEPNGQIMVLFMIKSAINNFAKRDAIRRTWAEQTNYDNFLIKRTFIIGACNYSNVIDCRREIDRESRQHDDLIEVDFHDAYYNNTLKTMHAFKWIVQHCPQASFTLFVDDDFYVSPSNLIHFIDQTLQSSHKSPDTIRTYAGFVQKDVSPIRDRTSKWYVSWADYPYSVYPPFINAGSYLLSKSALIDMFYASYYVKRFRFDDVYVAFLAAKVDVNALHNENFHRLSMPENYSRVIASHGFSDANELLRFWNSIHVNNNDKNAIKKQMLTL